MRFDRNRLSKSRQAKIPCGPMCGRFAQCSDADTLAQSFGLESVPEGITPRYNVAPTQPVLAVRLGGSGHLELTSLRWGLVPSWSKGPDNRYSPRNDSPALL